MSLPAEAHFAPSLVVRKDDGVPVLEIPEDLDLPALREWADAHLPGRADEVAGRTIRIDIGRRLIQLLDLRRLIHHLEHHHDVSVTGLYATPDAVHRFAERELKLKLFTTVPTEDDPDDLLLDPPEPMAAEEPPPLLLDPDTLAPAEQSESTVSDADEDDDQVLPDEKLGGEPEDEDPSAAEASEAAPKAPEPAGNRTLTVNRTVRSGSAVRFDGDVTIFGDVNPGSQVTASGSIVVLGTLKGVAHAGATGDESAFILALQLRPTQLRIGRRIAIPPEDPSDGPEIAVVRQERIVVEPYHARLPARGT